MIGYSLLTTAMLLSAAPAANDTIKCEATESTLNNVDQKNKMATFIKVEKEVDAKGQASAESKVESIGGSINKAQVSFDTVKDSLLIQLTINPNLAAETNDAYLIVNRRLAEIRTEDNAADISFDYGPLSKLALKCWVVEGKKN